MRESLRGDIEKILAALDDGGVRYLVVGGLAVVLHGHLRTTVDLDLVVQLEPKNVERALSALQRLGYQPVAPVPILEFADPEARERWIRDKNMIVFSLWLPDRPIFKVDLFVAEPFEFEPTYERSIKVDLGAAKATVLALEDLIALKRDAGRPQDLADVEALERIREQRGRTT
ncbi:MAG: nucleotidyltransferase family protein [Acidobacteriota bacterium]|nr:nucleotidyltransferase family protein [Acidobacteriota bacterium]MDH3523790.1 nucleotidyltransferase family protein [Acidobacteriota bacterium]